MKSMKRSEPTRAVSDASDHNVSARRYSHRFGRQIVQGDAQDKAADGGEEGRIQGLRPMEAKISDSRNEGVRMAGLAATIIFRYCSISAPGTCGEKRNKCVKCD